MKDFGWKRLLLLATGTFILAFGLYNVHTQSGVTEGGVLGATLLLRHWFHISPAVSEVVIDLLCYLLAIKILGKGFAKTALISTLLYAGFYGLLERFEPVLPNWSDQLWMAAIVGGLFVGIGVGLVVRCGGACGGDDALALSISKLSGWPVEWCYLLTDVTVLLLSLSYIPLKSIIWSLLTVTISSFLIGRLNRKEGVA